MLRKEFKKSLFADDSSFILDGSLKSFENLIDVLDNFTYLSGSKLNSKKCLRGCGGLVVNTSDSGSRGRGFELPSGRRVVSLSKTYLSPKKYWL